jgi:cell wall-associated NlpC family hydrolase
LTADPCKYVEGAIAWALDKVGVADYTALCYAFVEDAYELGNGIVLDGLGRTAKEAADAYGAAENQGVPPRGAYVFYSCFGTLKGEYRDWGHVGLSLGGGQVIHAWDRVRIDDVLGVEELVPAPGFEKPRYIGWTPVEKILRGMTVRTNA